MRAGSGDEIDPEFPAKNVRVQREQPSDPEQLKYEQEAFAKQISSH